MAKNATISIRIENEKKKELEDKAKHYGFTSLSEYLIFVGLNVDLTVKVSNKKKLKGVKKLESYDVCNHYGKSAIRSTSKDGLIEGLKTLDLKDFDENVKLFIYLDYENGYFYGDILPDGHDNLYRWDDFVDLESIDFDELDLIALCRDTINGDV